MSSNDTNVISKLCTYKSEFSSFPLISYINKKKFEGGSFGFILNITLAIWLRVEQESYGRWLNSWRLRLTIRTLDSFIHWSSTEFQPHACYLEVDCGTRKPHGVTLCEALNP